MRRAAIVAPVRTPVGKFLGALKDIPAERLAAHAIAESVKRAGIDPARIEDVVFAQSYANSEAPCIGRWAALAANLPIEVPGIQIDRRCAGGLQAIVTAAMMVETGVADVVVAGGVESMSNIEYYTTAMRGGARAGNVQFYDRLERGRERSQPVERFGVISGMIETAENVAMEMKIAREDADAFAAESHARAARAQAANLFDPEIVAVPVPQKKGDPLLIKTDEGVRADTTAASLGGLKPLSKNGQVTAGNSSQQNDAAAACLIVAEDQLHKLNLKPMGFLKGWAAAGCHPATMGLGPVPAVNKLFARLGLKWNQIDLVELNEAFAAQVLGVLRGWDWDDRSKLNVNGGGISLGHPIGATGARIMVTLLHEMQRRKAKLGLETMCVGGGQGMAAVFEGA